MRRRAFILALGGAAAWPLAARAQQAQQAGEGANRWRCIMSKLVTAVALATLVASLAFAQSYDPGVGSGNIRSSISFPAEQSPAARRGLIFTRVHCAQCHAIDKVSASPLKTARPLRMLQISYPVSDLQRPLAEGIHRMPPIRLTSGQLADVMAYLKTLEP